MPPYVKLGTTGHWRRQLVISDEGKTFIHRGSLRLGSAMAFSLTIESYWSIESSRVLELRITSRPMNSASFFTPGILERCGCQLSAQTPFSEETQTPSGVLITSDWLPSVCPGVDIRATPVPSSTSPSRSTRFSSSTWSMPPGTYQAHCIGWGERRVSTSLRWHRNFARGKKGLRGSGSPSTACEVPIRIRMSCTCRWSNETKATSAGDSPQEASACSTVLYSLASTLFESHSP